MVFIGRYCIQGREAAWTRVLFVSHCNMIALFGLLPWSREYFEFLNWSLIEMNIWIYTYLFLKADFFTECLNVRTKWILWLIKWEAKIQAIVLMIWRLCRSEHSQIPLFYNVVPETKTKPTFNELFSKIKTSWFFKFFASDRNIKRPAQNTKRHFCGVVCKNLKNDLKSWNFFLKLFFPLLEKDVFSFFHLCRQWSAEIELTT